MSYFGGAEPKVTGSGGQQHAAGPCTYLNRAGHRSGGFERFDTPVFAAVMVLGKPVVWAVIVSAIVTFER